MITFFSVPKPFRGHIGVIQSNAVRSWKFSHRDAEVILFGDEYGVAEFSDMENLMHQKNVEKTPLGTPTLKSIFATASKIAKNDIVCFINADIIIFEEIFKAVGQIQFSDFLIVGPRFNVNINDEIDFSRKDWRNKVMTYVDLGVHNGEYGSDFFIFPKNGVCADIPPFAVGRPAWDHWMFFNARRRGIPLIDSRNNIINIHQNHGYEHVKEQHFGEKWEGPEGNMNRFLLLESILEGRNKFSHIINEKRREIMTLRSLSGEEQTKRVFSTTQLIKRNISNYYLDECGVVKKKSAKDRFLIYCEYADVLKPDWPVLNRWARRFRNCALKKNQIINK